MAEQKDATDELKVDNSTVNAVSAKCIQALTVSMFKDASPDTKKCKIAWRGSMGPAIVDWDDADVGDMHLRDTCNSMPDNDGIFFNGSASKLPDGYSSAMCALPIPQATENQEYLNAKANAVKMDNLLTVQVNLAKDAFKNYLAGCKDKGNDPAYKTWSEYLKNEKPGENMKYEAALDTAQEALNDVRRVAKVIKNSTWAQSVNAFGDWTSETQSGTKGADSYWKATTDYVKIISGWKDGENKDGMGTCQFDNKTKVYEKTVVEGVASFFFDIVAIGGCGNGENVFTDSSSYDVAFTWTGSATINVNPPGAARYNFSHIRENRDGPLADGTTTPKPLTGTAKSAIPGIITGIVIAYGLGLKAKFDKETADRIKTKTEEGVSFGFFSIGSEQTHEKATWDQEGTSMTAGPTNKPVIVGYIIDPLDGSDK